MQTYETGYTFNLKTLRAARPYHARRVEENRTLCGVDLSKTGWCFIGRTTDLSFRPDHFDCKNCKKSV